MKILKGISLCLIYPLFMLGIGFYTGVKASHFFYPGEQFPENINYESGNDNSAEQELMEPVQVTDDFFDYETADGAEDAQEAAVTSTTLCVDTNYVLEEADILNHTVVETSTRLPDRYIGMDREQFLQATAAGKKAALRMGDYYTLDESRCTPEYYAAAKGDYPMFFLSDLSYDGGQYTVTSYEDGKKREDAYAYLRRFEGPAESPNASYQSYIRYIVTNHDTASWEEILFSSASSQLGAYIPYVSVYTELIG